MPQKQNRANHKYSPWYHLCSEGVPPHSKTDNGGRPLPLALAGRQNSGATSSPPSRKLTPAASSLGIPRGSTALHHRLLEYSGILLYLLPEVKRKCISAPASSGRDPPPFPRIYTEFYTLFSTAAAQYSFTWLKMSILCKIHFIQLQFFESFFAKTSL